MSAADRRFAADLVKYYRIELGSVHPPLTRAVGVWLNSFGLHCVAVYRLGRWAERVRRRFGLLPAMPALVLHRVVSYWLKMVHHIDIDAADIGPGLYIGHVGTIYIGPTTIGSNFSIVHNTTIGMGHSNGRSGIPRIGNNVWIGTGSVLSGDITIGNGVTITPGTMLSRDIPDNCLIGGNPARVLMLNHDNSALFATSASAAPEPANTPAEQFTPPTAPPANGA